MNKLVHKLQDVAVEPAINDEEIILEFAPDEFSESAEPKISISTTDFAYSNALKINRYVDDGATGNGVGINEGMKYSIDAVDDSSVLPLVDGYLVLNDPEVLFSKETIENVPIEMRGEEDSFSRRSKNVTFRAMVVQGTIDPETDYVQVPYERNTIPNYSDAAIAAITGYVVVAKTVDIGKDINKVLGGLVSVLGAFGAIINMVFVIAWVVIVLAQIIVFITDVFDHLIQPVKYHASMKLKQLFELGCAELGLEFQSSIFDDKFFADSVVMPKKFKSKVDINNEFSLGFTIPESTKTTGYPEGSFFEFVEKWKILLRASVAIKDGKFIFEKITDPDQSPTVTLPPLRREEWRTNQSDLASNYEVLFAEDLSDENTIDDYEGTITNAITTPKQINDEGSVLLDGLTSKSLTYSRASRKEELNNIQKRAAEIINAHSKAVNQIIIVANIVLALRNIIIRFISNIVDKLSVVGITIPFNPQPIPALNPVIKGALEDRIGIMLLSKDFFVNDKIMSLDINANPRLTKLKTDNRSKWHSKFIYDNFHAGQGFAISDEFPFGNQFRIYTGENFHMCQDVWEQVILNKRIFTDDGQIAIVTNLKWQPKTGIALSIEYRIAYIETVNLKIETQTPDGQ